MTLEDEILAALREIGPDGVSGHQISHWIEDHSPKRPWRFLWWHGELSRLIGFGTLYRALDRLRDRGLVTRTRYDDRDPPRFVYRLVMYDARPYGLDRGPTLGDDDRPGDKRTPATDRRARE